MDLRGCGARGWGGGGGYKDVPRDIAAFTGRQPKLGQLMGRWAEAAAGGAVVGIHAIGGMAGIACTDTARHHRPRPARSWARWLASHGLWRTSSLVSACGYRY